MIERASGFRIVVGGFSRPLRGVGVIGMPNAGFDTTQPIEVSPGDVGLPLIVTLAAVGVFRDRRCVSDGVEATR
jgi:hypothetical protein